MAAVREFFDSPRFLQERTEHWQKAHQSRRKRRQSSIRKLNALPVTLKKTFTRDFLLKGAQLWTVEFAKLEARLGDLDTQMYKDSVARHCFTYLDYHKLAHGMRQKYQVQFLETWNLHYSFEHDFFHDLINTKKYIRWVLDEINRSFHLNFSDLQPEYIMDSWNLESPPDPYVSDSDIDPGFCEN